jgi:3',5'-cyclic AMP phosphodiesterase CpdA
VRKLLHISDLHFGPNYLADRAQGVRAMVAERQPDYVLVSGDLTRRAKARQFRAARAFLQKLDAEVLAVPGNHDVPLYRVFARALAPFYAYRRHYSAELEPTLEDDEVVVVGLNTAFNWTFTRGRMTRRQARSLESRFAGASANRYRIVVLHHHLAKPVGLEDEPRPIWGADAARRALHRADVDLVLGGHLHQSFVAPLLEGAPAGGFMLYAGTATCSRGRGSERGVNTCHWIELEDREARVEFLRWDGAARSFVAVRSEAFARRRASGAPPP